MTAPFTILPTDRRFHTSPEPGDPLCLCSRCWKAIDEQTVPIRAWPESGAYEYRFHPSCLGFDSDDDDDELEDRP